MSATPHDITKELFAAEEQGKHDDASNNKLDHESCGSGYIHSDEVFLLHDLHVFGVVKRGFLTADHDNSGGGDDCKQE